jgi:PII-like signaling protein
MTEHTSGTVRLTGRNKLLRVFIGELDKVGGRPLYEAILFAAQAQGVAGVTVLRGVAAYGASSRLHTARILRLSEDLPIVVEIVDRDEVIEAFLKVLDGLLEQAGGGGLITLEAVEVIRYFHRSG